MLKDFVKKHIELFTLGALFLLCYFLFFYNIGNYPLMDVDETRYVSMARDMFNTKDFLTLYLNGEYFFEKPPLYFWMECLSFGLLGKINEFSARFPCAFCAFVSVLSVYFTGRKIVSRRYGLISALIFATSLEYVILAKYAILDILLATCVTFAVISGFLTQFVPDKNKKYFWWLFYLFAGLGVLAKGIPGVAIPFAVMFFVLLFTKNIKEAFKPLNIIPGVIIFFLISLPWHIIMLKIHNPLFFREYIYKHHIERFLNSEEIGRKQPFWFYFVTILWGFFPWTFSAIASLFRKYGLPKSFVPEKLSNAQKYLLFNVIGFVTVMLFFSASSTKLITYILPVYMFIAGITGFVWQEFLDNKAFVKNINISSYICGTIFILASAAALLTPLYLPQQIYNDISSLKFPIAFLLLTVGIALVAFTMLNRKKSVFITYVIFMTVLSSFATKEIYKTDYKFGQNDLMEFARYAEKNDFNLASFGFSRRFSLLYYYGKHVEFQVDDNYSVLKKMLDNKNNVIVIKNKKIKDFPDYIQYNVIDIGRKYTLVKGK